MFNITEVSNKVGLSKHTLRYYEKIELLIIPKDAKGHRTYKDTDLNALIFIKCLTKTGMPLDQIKELSKLALKNPEKNTERILSILELHRTKILSDLSESKQSLKMIESKIELANSL